MACYSIVTLNTAVKASADEVADAAQSLGLKVKSRSALQVDCGNISFARPDSKSAWSVTGQIDLMRFTREVARSKVLSEARRMGYRVTRNEHQGDRIVIRMQAR